MRLECGRFMHPACRCPAAPSEPAPARSPPPAPATREILAQVGAPTRPSPVLGELVTPTGAAILAELATFEQPMMRVRRVGYGYGTKELPWPNAVRVWLGEPWAPGPPRPPTLVQTQPSVARRAQESPPPHPPPPGAPGHARLR